MRVGIALSHALSTCLLCVVLLVWVKRQSERYNNKKKKKGVKAERHKVPLVAAAFVVVLVFTAAAC